MSPLPRPCLDCGEPTTPGPRCPDCTPTSRAPRASRAAGYDTAWDKLSRRARKVQPWCTDCGTEHDLTADHSPEAWARKAAGKVIRLRDVDVVCRSCNSKRGAARGESARAETGGDPPPRPTGREGAVSREARYSLDPKPLTCGDAR